MSDDDVRRYERALKLAGRSPIEIGLGLLGIDTTMEMPEFEECQFCKRLSGSPTLCSGCNMRRALADALSDVGTMGLAPILAIAFAPEKRIPGDVNAHEVIAAAPDRLWPLDFSEDGMRRRELVAELLHRGRRNGHARMRHYAGEPDARTDS